MLNLAFSPAQPRICTRNMAHIIREIEKKVVSVRSLLHGRSSSSQSEEVDGDAELMNGAAAQNKVNGAAAQNKVSRASWFQS